MCLLVSWTIFYWTFPSIKGPSNLNRPQEFPRKGHLRLQREILLRVRPASLWWDDASGVPWQPTKVKLPNLWTSSSCGGRGGWPSYGEGQFSLLWRHNQWPQNRNLWKLVLGSGSWEQKRVLHRHLCQQRYRWSSFQSFCNRAWQTCKLWKSQILFLFWCASHSSNQSKYEEQLEKFGLQIFPVASNLESAYHKRRH